MSDIKQCNCEEMTCKKGCTRNHTHKGFSCDICKPKDIYQRASEMFDELDFSKFETEKDTVKYTMLHSEKIKDFIDQIISLAIQERNKEITEMMKNKLCSFAQVTDYSKAVESIGHLMFKRPNCNREEYLFLGKAQAMQDIINLINK